MVGHSAVGAVGGVISEIATSDSLFLSLAPDTNAKNIFQILLYIVDKYK